MKKGPRTARGAANRATTRCTPVATAARDPPPSLGDRPEQPAAAVAGVETYAAEPDSAREPLAPKPHPVPGAQEAEPKEEPPERAQLGEGESATQGAESSAEKQQASWQTALSAELQDALSAELETSDDEIPDIMKQMGSGLAGLWRR